ncbi:hypothetical protein UPYG_G00211140 [Umbra pygmaea]|uniref:Uncharacterized protein n=1 Tax=Umbra pygmaea TaxID=75934 RepID=A0ABD0WQ02_UMBPY
MITQVNSELNTEIRRERRLKQKERREDNREPQSAEGRESILQSKTYCRQMIKHVYRKERPEASKETWMTREQPPPGERRLKMGLRRQCVSVEAKGSEKRTPSEPVPLQFISALKLKSFREEMKRAVNAELHHPGQCERCLQQQATLSLNTFIRRKTTQLDAGTLEAKLQVHLCNRDAVCLLGEFLRDIPKPSDAPNWIWKQLQARERCTQQPGLAAE